LVKAKALFEVLGSNVKKEQIDSHSLNKD
jgi:hypothetical protein